MTVMVTGGTGFLGKSLVRQLLAAGIDTRCLVRPTSDVRPLEEASAGGAGRLELCRGDLGRPRSCAEALDGCDTVYHVAAEVSGATAVLFLGNVVATRTLMEQALRAGVKRFVLVSSLAVYGTAHLRPGGALDEDCPLDPQPHLRDPYTFSKVAQEQAAWAAHREQGLPLTVVRPGVIYGPGRNCITGRIGIPLGGAFLKIGGRRQLPYTFVDNCARAVLLAGTAPGVEGQAFNAVDDDPPTNRELLKLYRAEVGKLRGPTVPGWAVSPLSWLCEWYHGWSRGQLPAVLTRYKSAAMWKPLRFPNDRAKSRLGWTPEVSFAEGLQRTLAWWREHGRRSRPAA